MLLTISAADAVMEALGLGIKSVLVSQTTAVRESATLPFGFIESPFLDVVLAGSRLGLDEAPVRQNSLGRGEDFRLLDHVRLGRVCPVR